MENNIENNIKVKNGLDKILPEYKILQDIIARLENNEFKIRGWLFSIITALSVTYFSKKIDIGEIGYLIVSIFCTLIFLVYELLHRIPKRKAFDRVKYLDRVIKEGGNYDGPELYSSLSGKRSFNEIWQDFKNIQIWLPYLMIILFIITIIIFKNLFLYYYIIKFICKSVL